MYESAEQLESRLKGADNSVSDAISLNEPISIAVVLPWPEIKNAEYEFIFRLRRAAQNIGVLLYVIDRDGYLCFGSHSETRRKHITSYHVKFVISLHFDVPKLLDIYSYTTLWNPPEFFHSFGYKRSIEQTVTHDDFISCGSAIADLQALNAFAALRGSVVRPLPKMFHSVPKPYAAPNITPRSKIFYIGINWEKLGRTTGRHHRLLKALDQANLIEIYGPTEFQGAKPWEGYINYKGAIEFDGTSVISRIGEAGICLVFSSEAHRRSGIMSTRLFEGISGGAVIIADSHPFIVEHFKDCVYIVDHELPPELLFNEIRRIVECIRSDVASANRLVLEAQKRLEMYFSLEQSLSNIIEGHDTRRLVALGRIAINSITVITLHLTCNLNTLKKQLDNVSRQINVNATQILILDRQFYNENRQDIDQIIPTERNVSIVEAHLWRHYGVMDGKRERAEASGPLVLGAVKSVTDPFFVIMYENEEWFSDHLFSHCAALDNAPLASFSASGKIVETIGSNSLPVRDLESCIFDKFQSLMFGQAPGDGGRFVFRGSVIAGLPTGIFSLLDGFEANLLTLASFLVGELQNTSRATYVYNGSSAENAAKRVFPPELQHQFIRDCLTGTARWNGRFLELQDVPEVLYATGSSARIYWEHYRTPYSATYEARFGEQYLFCANGNGLKFVETGFSFPEPDRVWLEGTRGTLNLMLPGAGGVVEITLHLGGRCRSADQPQHCMIIVNGLMLNYVRVGEFPGEVRCLIPKPLLDGETDLRITLVADYADVPLDVDGRVFDDRALGVFLTEIRFDIELPSTKTEDVPEDEVIEPISRARLTFGGRAARWFKAVLSSIG